ncbi:hypothetical protein [Novipirellula artificiosorum]|uniref:Outer membrane efflux protein n=1 Tax=Novipirellula artificiosorum TaxID=2528016 RepID=A0A5C6DBN9_9BACT|nr:hypothetical protein [Novipirellula artificiosorum]TWU33264.1 hypothetical protein Poly41_50160 [Novipirellula artificiosorum]
MTRPLFAAFVMLGLVGFGYYAQAEKGDNPQAKDDLIALQQKRIELLEERVSTIERYVKANVGSRSDMVAAQMDVVNARLDYAQSNDQKQSLLSELLKMYDQQIEVAEVKTLAPISPGRSAKNDLAADSRLLLLRSERIRIQIERDMLD